MKRGWIMMSLILGLAVTSAGAEMSATSMLKKSYDSEARTSYTARIRTTLHSSSGDKSADVLVYRSGKKMRMEYLTGASAGSVIIDDGKSVTRLHSATKTAYISGTPEAPKRLDLLLANYTPVLIGRDSVAGRSCYLLAIRPRSSGNPSQRLWLDQKTFIALKTERYGFNGKRTTSTEYSSIDYSKHPASSLFALPRGWKTVRLAASGDGTLASVRAAVGFTPVKPGHVPAGYGFDGYYLRQNPRGMRFAGLRYTNGMNTISIFQHKGQCGNGQGFGRGRGRGQGGAGRGCASCMLAESPHMQMVCTYTGGLTIVVIGDLSSEELARTANSF